MVRSDFLHIYGPSCDSVVGALEQLAVISGVKVIAARFVRNASSFVVKVDIFRSAVVADVMPRRTELPSVCLIINGALQPPFGGMEIPLSAYEHMLRHSFALTICRRAT